MFVNGTRADDLAGTGLVAKQRWVIPLWLSLIGLAFAVAARLAVRLLLWAARHPLITATLAALVASYWVAGTAGLLALVLAVPIVLALWRARSPESFSRLLVARVLGWWRWQIRYRRLWYPALNGSGLTVTTPAREVYVPQVTAVRSTRLVDTLHVRLLHGHTPVDLSQKAEGLRHSFAVHRCTVVEDGPGRVRLVIYRRDPLTAPVPAFDPAELPAVPDFGGLPVGRVEDGETYRLRLLGTHVLVAGATNAGKGSVLWSTLRGLGPGIGTGLVRVTGVDPKGGMELYPGRPLFTYYADEDPEECVSVLEGAAERLTVRKRRLRGQARKFTPSVLDPFEIIMIDELAFLTAYAGRAIKSRMKDVLAVLLSQGRAPGFAVIAALQDPRKEVLDLRGLFPTRVALRLAESGDADMVLGDGALDRGARCHEIPEALPGVGYVRIEGAAEPRRVRFTWITDDDITDMAALWPAPPLTPQAQVINLRPFDRPSEFLPEPRQSTEQDQADYDGNRSEGGEGA